MKNRISPQLLRLHATNDISTTTANSPLLSAYPGIQRCSGALITTTSRKSTSTAASGTNPAAREVFESVKSLTGVRVQMAMTASVPSRTLRQVMPRACDNGFTATSDAVVDATDMDGILEGFGFRCIGAARRLADEKVEHLHPRSRDSTELGE